MSSKSTLLLTLFLYVGCAHGAISPAGAPPTGMSAPAGLLEAGQRDLLAKVFERSRTRGTQLDAAETELTMLIAKDTGKDRDKGVAQRAVLRTMRHIDAVWGCVRESPNVVGADAFVVTAKSQAEAIRLYVLAWESWGGATLIKAAKDVDKYVARFLTSPEGAFYAAQGNKDSRASSFFLSLDDDDRRSYGLPPIDQRILGAENGRLIGALARLYQSTHDRDILDRARRAAEYVSAHLKTSDGGFAHEDPSLGADIDDTLAIADGLSAMTAATGEQRWAEEAEAAVHYASIFVDDASVEQRAELAKLATAVERQTGDARLRRIAVRAVRGLTGVNDSAQAARLLLADRSSTRTGGARLDQAPTAMIAARE